MSSIVSDDLFPYITYFEKDSYSLLLPNEEVSPNENIINVKCLQLAFFPNSGFKASIKCRNLKGPAVLREAWVETRFYISENLKTKIVHLAQVQGYFLKHFDVKIERSKNKTFKVILTYKENFDSSPSILNSNFSETEQMSYYKSYRSIQEPLNEVEIINGVKALKQFPSLEEKFFELINESKTNADLAIAAGNAITILNKANVNLSSRDFKGVRIPYADLSYAVLTNTDLSYADLRNVNFFEAILDYSTFVNSNWEGVRLGAQPLLDKESGKRSPVVLAISGDGLWIARSDENYNICLWNRNNDERRVFKGHQNEITWLIFAKNSNNIVSASLDRSIRLWDFQTGKELQRFEKRAIDLCALTITPDGENILYTQGKYRTGVLNCKTGAEVKSIFDREGPAKKFIFTSNGKLAFCTAKDNDERVFQHGRFEITSSKHKDKEFIWYGNLESVEKVPFSKFDCWAFSGNGKKMITSSSRSLELWDCESWEQKKSHSFAFTMNSRMTCLTFSPNDQWIISGNNDCAIQIWNTDSLREIICFEKHTSPITNLQFSIDGKVLISSSSDGNVWLWDMKALESASRNKFTSFTKIKNVALSPDGKDAFIVTDKKIFELVISEIGNQYKLSDFEPNDFSLSINSENVTSGFSQGFWCSSERKIYEHNRKKVTLIPMAKDEVVKPVTKLDEDLFIQYSPFGDEGCWIHGGISKDGQWVLSTGKIARVWEIHTEKEVIQCKDSGGDQIDIIALSADNKIVLTAEIETFNNKIKYPICVWDCDLSKKTLFSSNKGKLLFRLMGHTKKVMVVIFSYDSLYALSGSKDCTVRLWDCVIGKQKFCFEGHEDSVTSVAFSSNNQLVLSGSLDKTIRLWDCMEGKELLCIKQRNEIVALHFFPNDKRIFLATQTDIQIWQVFDQNQHLKPVLLQTSQPSFSANQLNLTGVVGLSDLDRKFLSHRGVIFGINENLKTAVKTDLCDPNISTIKTHFFSPNIPSIKKNPFPPNISYECKENVDVSIPPPPSSLNDLPSTPKGIPSKSPRTFDVPTIPADFYIGFLQNFRDEDLPPPPPGFPNELLQSGSSVPIQLASQSISPLTENARLNTDPSSVSRSQSLSRVVDKKQHLESSYNSISTDETQIKKILQWAQPSKFDDSALIGLQNQLSHLQNQVGSLQILHQQNELKRLIAVEQMKQKKEEIRQKIVQDDVLYDFFYVFAIQWSDIFLASKAIHSDMVMDSSKNAIDYLNLAIEKGSQYVSLPGVALIKDVLVACTFWNDRKKKEGVNQVANSFISLTESDAFILDFALQLTVILENELKKLKVKKAGKLRSLARVFVDIKNKVTANDIDTAIKEYAAEQAKKVLQAIMDEKIKCPPKQQDIPIIIEKLFDIATPEQQALLAQFTTPLQISIVQTNNNINLLSSSDVSSSFLNFSPSPHAVEVKMTELQNEVDSYKKQMEKVQEELARLKTERLKDSNFNFKIRQVFQTVEKIESAFSGTQLLAPNVGEDNKSLYKQFNQQHQIDLLTNLILPVSELLGIKSVSAKSPIQKEEEQKSRYKLFES